MGMSADGILFWGFGVGEEWDEDSALGLKEGEFGTRYDSDLSHLYADRAHGIDPPAVEWSEETKEQYHVYWDKCRAAKKSHGIDEGYHCSCDYPMPYFAVAESVTKAYQGCPEEITSLEVKPAWRKKLEDYCKVMGLEMQEPKWWLVSLWG